MKKKKPKVNPNCSVQGCKATAPHTNDLIVKALVQNMSDPAKVAHWTLASIAELGKSMAADLAADRRFALLTRSRQQEELYIRALYALFIATPDEVIHIMSDATPNSFSLMYRKVNTTIFGGKGLLEVVQPGLTYGTFSAMAQINSAAHASFSTMMQVIVLGPNAEYLKAYKNGEYFDHISVYCSYLDHVRKLFAAGKNKPEVLAELIHLHLPKTLHAALAQAATVRAKRKSDAAQESGGDTRK
jgi:hypothetical protein